MSGSRFKDARLLCALSVPEAGKLFRVTPRTVQNWEAGRTIVPYAAFKLMRILRGYELPGYHWKGYRLKGDTLWSPEGKAFKAEHARWWLLTCLMAQQFRTIMATMRGDPAAAPSVSPTAQAVGLPDAPQPVSEGVHPAPAHGLDITPASSIVEKDQHHTAWNVDHLTVQGFQREYCDE